jgi:hypothetical protein
VQLPSSFPSVSAAPILDNERVSLLAPEPLPTDVNLDPYREELAREELGLPPPYKEESEQEEDEEPDNEEPDNEEPDNEAGVDMTDSQSETSSVSSASTPKTKKARPPPTVEQMSLAEALANMMIDVSQMDRVSVLDHLAKLVVKKECDACGKKLVGKYLEIGTCAKCTPKKPKEEYVCQVCGKNLIKHFRDIGLCTKCNKLKIRKEEKAAKEGQKKK